MTSAPQQAVEATKTTTPASTDERRGKDQSKLGFCELGEFVTFLVGPADTPEKFLVHKNFACHYSSVLKAAFNSTFIGGQTQTYKMEDTTAGAFAIFVEWLYTQKVENPSQVIPGHWPALMRLWVLAEKLLIPRLQNQVLDAIEDYRQSTSTICTPEFRYVYENTKDGSPLRNLLTSICIWQLKASVFHEFLSHFPQEMLGEIAFRFRKLLMAKGGAASWKVAAFYVNEEENSS